MTNLVTRLPLVLSLLLLLWPAGILTLSTFHQDVAFSYIDTDGATKFPGNTYDNPPLLDRRGTGDVFVAPFPGIYVFTFHAPGKNSPSPTPRVNYQLVRSSQPVLQLSADGPVSGHALLDLEFNDRVMIDTLNGSATPVANTKVPVIFNGFLLYHRCLCSPLVLRQSAFSAYRVIDLPRGKFTITNYVLNLGHADEFDVGSGIFTASLPGIYVFMYSFPNQNSGPRGSVTMSLIVNDAVKSSVTSVSSAHGPADVQYAGTTIVLDLVIGDRVRLEKRLGSIVLPTVSVGGSPVTVSPILFSGYLL